MLPKADHHPPVSENEKGNSPLKKEWTTPGFEKLEIASRILWLLQPGPGPGGPPSGPS